MGLYIVSIAASKCLLQPHNSSLICKEVLAHLDFITAGHGFLHAQRQPRLWCLLAV